MRIVLKPLGAFLVIGAFFSLIGLLLMQYNKQGQSVAAVPAGDATKNQKAVPSTPISTEGNLLRNAGFDAGYESVHGYDNKAVLQGMVPAPWRDDSSWAHVNIAYAADKAMVHSGVAALKIDLLSVQHKENELDSLQMVQELPLTRGQKYHAGVWLRADHPVEVTLTLRQAAEPFTPYGSRTVKIGTDWQQVTADATVTQAGNSFFLISCATPGVLWVDDATLTVANP